MSPSVLLLLLYLHLSLNMGRHIPLFPVTFHSIPPPLWASLNRSGLTVLSRCSSLNRLKIPPRKAFLSFSIRVCTAIISSMKTASITFDQFNYWDKFLFLAHWLFKRWLLSHRTVVTSHILQDFGGPFRSCYYTCCCWWRCCLDHWLLPDFLLVFYIHF